MAKSKWNILIVSAEVAPFAKVGGLADVAGSLPKALKAQGHDVRVVMPAYKMVETNPAYAVEEVLPAFSVPVRAGVVETAYLKKTRIPGGAKGAEIPVYLIGNLKAPMHTPNGSGYFQQATESKKVYTLEPDPYIYFCYAVLEMLTQLSPDWVPDVIHCNDWQSGLLPVLAREFYTDSPAIDNAATVFTIHNFAYQGNFPRHEWPLTGLPDSLYDMYGLEFFGQWSFMKGGLLFADRVNTVSETYATEIQTPAYGCGLDGLTRTLTRQGRLSGIVNGIDYEEHDPATDKRLPANFSARAPKGKEKCKAALCKELGLPFQPEVPLVGLISRLADQKGLDLIAAVAEKMLALPVQFVLLGTGDPTYESYFAELEKRYPEQVRACLRFDVDLAQRVYGGSDLFLMPSRFEPCGLGQMFALRYGSIPIVRATGGLADTVYDYDPQTSPDGNGFVFTEYSADALLATIQRAVTAYSDKAQRQTLRKRALNADFSWDVSAKKYLALFEEAIAARRAVQREMVAAA